MRPVLRLVPEGTGGGELRLDEGTALIGRGAGAALRVDDPAVSGRHALVCAGEGGFYVADQKSTNGTWVNGERVQTAWLHDGDVLRLGPRGPALRVVVAAPESRPAVPRFPELPATPPVREGGRVARAFDNQAIARAMRGPAPPAVPGSNTVAYLVASAGIGALMLVVGGLLLLELGPSALVVGTVAAFLPAPLYVATFLWLDRYDPEPRWALFGAFAWGGLISILVSAIGNTVFGITATALSSQPTGSFLTAVISAPLVEEGTKGVGLVLVLLLLRRHFDGVVDGIVYAGLIALGFATVENVQYYGRMFAQAGFGGVLVLGILRGVLSPFAHALFTSMTGIGCGLARESHRRATKIVAPVAGLLLAMALHSAWNFVASKGAGHFLLVYFLVWLPLFLVFVAAIVWLARREVRIVREMLKPEVAAGLLTEDQLDIVSSMFRRVEWSAAMIGDRARFRARRDFLACAARLGLCYWHVVRASAAGVYTMSLPRIPQFREELQRLSARI